MEEEEYVSPKGVNSSGKKDRFWICREYWVAVIRLFVLVFGATPV